MKLILHEACVTAKVTWANLTGDSYTFWVKVDSSEVVTESVETDNLAQGIMLINPHQTFLSIVLRDG
jgi:hypothetical protein